MNRRHAHPSQASIVGGAKPRSRRGPIRRAFSVVEMLIALTISSLLLTACLVALDDLDPIG